jgi:L-glutamine-phosphate cytidylyltransferase
MPSLDNAIILAAGHGSRMGALTAERPKALLEVAGYSLIDRQIDALTMSGIANITVVTGYRHERLHEHLGRRVSYVHNDRYSKSNSLYSLWLARHVLRKGSMVMNSDILVSPVLIARLLGTPARDAALIDPRSDMGAEEMKVRLWNGFIEEFSKDMPPEKAHGENVGILKFSPQGGIRLVHHLDTLVYAGMTNAWAPLAFGALAREWPLVAVSTHGIPWTEIDFPEDLARAEQVIAPQLAKKGYDPRTNAGVRSRLAA